MYNNKEGREKMKKFLSSCMLGVLFVNLFSVSAYADSTEFLEHCKENYTEVVVDVEADDVRISQIENLWNDRSVITEEDIAAAETYKTQNGKDMYYGLTVKVTELAPFAMQADSWSPDMGTKPDNMMSLVPNEKINRDASLKALCTEDNYYKYLNVVSVEPTDSNWYVVSLEKYSIMDGNKQLAGVALGSQEAYTVTFDIPKEYSETTDLKMAKIDNANTSATYVEDIDNDASTYTISTTCSASFVFVGKAHYDYDNGRPTLGEVGSTQEMQTLATDAPEQTDTPNRNTNTATPDDGTAPKTNDSVNVVIYILAMAFSCLLLSVSRRKCEQ